MSTLEIEDDLAEQLEPYQSQVREILEHGIREWQARGEAGFSGINDVLEKLATLPDPNEILELRPTPALQARIEALLEKSRSTGFTAEERREWERYEYAEHLVCMAKINATIKLQRNGS